MRDLFYYKTGISFKAINCDAFFSNAAQLVPLVITVYFAWRFILYLNACCNVVSESGTFISLHSTIIKGFVSLSYTTISKRFFTSPSISCFSTAINETGYKRTSVRYNKKFCLTHSSGVITTQRLRTIQNISSFPSSFLMEGFLLG